MTAAAAGMLVGVSVGVSGITYVMPLSRSCAQTRSRSRDSIHDGCLNSTATGSPIYAQKKNTPQQWERAASIEWINPDGSKGFQINGGLQIQGNASREPNKSGKHSFRLLFKNQYGASKLDYPIFGDDELTDEPLRSIVAEMVREKILASTGEEIPYVTAVATELFDESAPGLTRIFCAIYVERPSQKKIVIGKLGARIKDIGTKARVDIEKLLGKKVFLKLFVKVVEDWRNRERDLDDIGIHE